MKNGFIDMHIHSTNSDGELSPQEVVETSAKNNVTTISITDHDVIPNRRIYSSITINYKTIKLIPGAELSTDYYIGKRKIRIHLLAYDAVDKDGNLHNELEKLELARYEGNYAYIQMLLNKFNFLSKTDFEGFDYSKYGWLKKRILSYLDLSKYSDYEKEMLLKCLKEIKPIYPKCTFNLEEGIGLVKEAEGITSFAHPYQTKLNKEELETLLDKMKWYGLDAIETFHASAPKSANNLANDLADEYKLLKSCGSDFHKYDSSGNKIGLGINENMNITQTSLSDYLVKNKKFFCNGNYKKKEEDNER